MEKSTEQNTRRENQEPQETATGAGGDAAGAGVNTQEEEDSQTPSAVVGEADAQGMAYRPLTRIERRNLWLKEYGEQDFALQMWVRLVEQQDLDVEMMFQMQGLLVFGVMVSTARYAHFYIDLNEELHRERDPEVADALRDYYNALIPALDRPEIGPEGLPIIYRYVHMRDVTIMSAGHKVKVPYWRGQVNKVDAFVIGATAGE